MRALKRHHKEAAPQKQKPLERMLKGFVPALVCLTMSYFHERMLTIIGAKAFHGPVRDGKGWFHLAMVVRHNLLTRAIPG